MMPLLATVCIQRRVSGFEDLIRRGQERIYMTRKRANVEYLWKGEKKERTEKEKSRDLEG